MLSEEALILYGFFLGLGLLALGMWETLAPSRPRVPPRPPIPDHEGGGAVTPSARDVKPR
jgi:hypothetical protein